MLRKGMVFALTASIALAGCAYGDADTAPAPIRDKEAKILAKELKGKVAGEHAGSKLAKTKSLDVALLDESALTVLLVS